MYIGMVDVTVRSIKITACNEKIDLFILTPGFQLLFTFWNGNLLGMALFKLIF